MRVGLVAREYEVVNRPVMDVFDAACALGLTSFFWDRSLSVRLEFQNLASCMHFWLAFNGSLTSSSPLSILIAASDRELAESLLTQLGLSDEVDAIEPIRVLLASDGEHASLLAALNPCR